MKYYLVINEWNYPTESGREFACDFDTREEAEHATHSYCEVEKDNFLKVNNDIYREASGLYHNNDGTIAGYMIHSSQYEEEDMYFRSFIIEVEAWK